MKPKPLAFTLTCLLTATVIHAADKPSEAAAPGANRSGAPAAPAGETVWKKVETVAFSFSIPPELRKSEAHGTDSLVGEYAAEGISVSFDYGWYSNNFSDWPKETKFENVKVGGRDARIGTVAHEFQKGFPFTTQIHFKLDERMRLSVFAACKSEKELAVARRIFESIAFKGK